MAHVLAGGAKGVRRVGLLNVHMEEVGDERHGGVPAPLDDLHAIRLSAQEVLLIAVQRLEKEVGAGFRRDIAQLLAQLDQEVLLQRDRVGVG